MDKDFATKDLIAIKQLLDARGIQFFLAYGTALGAVRDKDFIEYDDDIDLIITQKLTLKERKKIGWALEDIGFKTQSRIMFNVFGRMESVHEGYNGTEETGIIVVERYVNVSIFFFCQKDDKFVVIPKLGSFPILETEKRFFEKGEVIKFKNESFLVPSPIKEYLEYTYGNWKEPRKGEHAKQFSEIYGIQYLKDNYGVE